ncbi:MAG: protein kinase [Acidobacteriota bacterium]
MIGETLSHYRIISKIGAGGMGEVYLAEDTHLKRRVALKVLLAEVADDEDRVRRFVQEAKAASALNHPNILTVYEVGHFENSRYIATELIKGETLRDRLRVGPLPLRDTLDVVLQVAAALNAAHEAGIVHRDIKPENIMLRDDGLAKVLDFGLAKLTEKKSEASSSEDVTRVHVKTSPGLVMGTVAYMSPEQARGKEIDSRSDIWSLGVVIYEMLTRRAPFAEETTSDSIAAILTRDAAPLDENTPMELRRIIRKTLQRKADERYQTIRDLQLDLKALKRELEFSEELERSQIPSLTRSSNVSTTQTAENATFVVPPSGGSGFTLTQGPPEGGTTNTSSAEYLVSEIRKHKRSVATLLAVVLVAVSGAGYWFSNLRGSSEAIDSLAVLPFQNKSSDADTEYLSDGLAESLIYRLSQLPNLKVSPTSSVFRYKGKETDPIRIGGELGVNAVMSGRIVQRGESLTISVELVDVRNNKLLWGEQYERKMSELLATQREIATEITNKLQLKLSGEDQKGLTKRYTENNEAYQLYLKGRYHYAKRTKDDVLKSIDYYQQAIKLDPNFALAYARIADSYNAMPVYPYLSPKEAIPQAKAAAIRALEIDPTLAEAHTAFANSLADLDWNWVEAEREFKRALELNPNDSGTHWRYGMYYLMPLGRTDEAIAEIKRGLELEPLDLTAGSVLSWAYFAARQYDQALDQAQKIFDLEPNFPLGRWTLSQAYICKGMYTEAIALNEQSLQTDPMNQVFLRFAGYAYAKSGRRHEAEEMIIRFKDIAKTQYVMSYRVANIYAALGDRDKAFAELEKAFAERDWELHRLKVDPLMDPLRDDPRFKEMLKRLNLPE